MPKEQLEVLNELQEAWIELRALQNEPTATEDDLRFWMTQYDYHFDNIANLPVKELCFLSDVIHNAMVVIKMTEEKPKTCVSCKYCYITYCTRPELQEWDIVTGYQYSSAMRNRKNPSLCGIEARYYEERKSIFGRISKATFDFIFRKAV